MPGGRVVALARACKVLITPMQDPFDRDWPDSGHQMLMAATNLGLDRAQKHARLLVLPSLLLCCSPPSCCAWTTTTTYLQVFPHGSIASTNPMSGDNKEHTGVGERLAEGVANTDQVGKPSWVPTWLCLYHCSTCTVFQAAHCCMMHLGSIDGEDPLDASLVSMCW